jgi:hypothetical protein
MISFPDYKTICNKVNSNGFGRNKPSVCHGGTFLKLTSNGNLIRVKRLICDASGRNHVGNKKAIGMTLSQEDILKVFVEEALEHRISS